MNAVPAGEFSENSAAGPLHVAREERFDGAVWTRYELDEGHLILTSSGRELLEQTTLSPALRQYRADFAAEAEGPEDTRRFLAQGMNGRVFTLGDRELVIKERLPDGWGQAIEPALLRMDTLNHVIQKHCPHWISMPQHYGLLVLPEEQREFLLMEKIDGGVTVSDIWNVHDQLLPENIEEAIMEQFGVIDEDRRDEVFESYLDTLRHVRRGLKAEDLDPEEYLPDMNMYNMLIEPLRTPVAESKYKMWVIDQ